MARKKKQFQNEEPGSPEWLVTFSDCITLLLTFFVLLISFASFEKETFESLSESFAQALPSIGWSRLIDRESFQNKQESKDRVQHTKGTETRTNITRLTSNYMQEKKPLDFRNLKVFTMPSEQFFWGQGTAISQSGREVLQALAKFLHSVQGRVVISENGPDGKTDLSLARCLTVLKYFTEEANLPAERFSISPATTLRTPPHVRQIEITLLERSIYE
ncbi:MAG TPA: flagellar motor protein MotB [Anaerohalosphaeraceae bacterium]|jgi:chemotaxis protein MotB|nr:flagellar motor protein MotB [Anaerohalosphaeraceae bacterium]HOT71684.1 flagellar motor protein MotB [Anaerohalosphaeraceae bacterium]HPB93413.1 flagellar motor protein MotB [Anaerohalosphaeraceae bacterium]HQG04657.1 flagellar motor protein MotB [Anaerohalosphaeraceae bacterium]HQI06513.1 flagellar motor protein MotB [Anaerohalosphaeraceae bacterium]